MLRRVCICLAVVAALSAAPAAAGDGPLFTTQGGEGVLTSDGTLRFVTLGVANGTRTELEAIQTKDGVVRQTLDLTESWGTPYIPSGTAGLSHDGRTLVLASTTYGSPSKFLVLDPRTLRIKNWLILKGTYSYDAMSPDGKRLYLIEYTQAKYGDLTHYVVRGYDVEQNKLLPGRIADRTQKSWVMDGSPMTRTTSADGRWVYTLYMNPGGFPFIHALDTVRGVAHCVGLPIQNQNGLYNIVLSLHGRTLAVHWKSGRPYFVVNTATWRVSPDHGAGFPWLWVTTGVVGAVTLAGVAAFLLRRRRREEFEQELVDLLGRTKREVMV
jgi:hypothetical protein